MIDIIGKRGVVCLWSLNSGDSREWEKGEWFRPGENVVRLKDVFVN